jgi:hypothetical protein
MIHKLLTQQPTMKSQTSQLTLLHVACVGVICACVALAFTVLKDHEVLQEILIGAAFLLWGKLGFTPAKPVLERIVQNMPPAEVVRIQSMKPPPPPPIEDPSPPPAADIS